MTGLKKKKIICFSCCYIKNIVYIWSYKFREKQNIMRKEFKTVLKNEDFILENFKKETDEIILSKKIKITWLINPQFEDWGVRYWRTTFMTFKAEVVLKNIKTDIERKVEFDEGSQNYELEINEDKYKMRMDFLITKVEINRETKTAVAFVQG